MRLLYIKFGTKSQLSLLLLFCLSTLINYSALAKQRGFVETRNDFQGNKLGLLYSIERNENSIFLGGENGLIKLTGNRVEPYNSIDQNSLIGEVRDIVTLDTSLVWLATSGNGVISFSPSNIKSEKFELIEGLSSQNCDRLMSLSKYKMLARCGGKVNVINTKSKLLDRDSTISVSNIIGDKDVKAMAVVEGKNIVLVVGQHLFYFKANLDLIDYSYLGNMKSVTSLHFLEQDRFIFGTTEGIVVAEKSSAGHWSFLGGTDSSLGYVNKIISLNEGVLAILADRPYLLDKDLKPLSISKFIEKEFSTFGKSSVNDAILGPDGGLLLVANLVGLVTVPAFTHSFNILEYDDGTDVKNIDFSYELSQEDIVFSVDGTIYQKNLFSNKSEILARGTGYVNRLILDNNDFLYTSISGIGLKRLDLDFHGEADSKFSEELLYELTDGEIYGMASAGNGSIVFGVAGGPEKGLYTYNPNYGLSIIREDFHVDAISVDSKSSLFVASRFGGVWERNREGIWREWSDNLGRKHVVKYCIEEDKSGTIWLCTNGNGLGYLDRETGQIKYIDSQYTANSKYIRELVQDTEGYFWVMTNQGLVRYDHDNVHSIRLGKEDGIVDTDFEVTASINLHDDRILIAGDKLNYILDTKQANAHLNERMRRTTKALIVDLNVFEKQNRNPRNLHAGNRRSFRVDDGLILSYDDFLFTLSFAANNYVDRKILGFEYRLIGLDDNWVSVPPNSATATFSTLPHGNYELQVRVSDPKSIEAQPVTQLRVKILPPFWLTWQAYSIYLVILLMIIWGAARLRTFKLKRDNALLEKTVGNKTFELNKSKRFVAELLDQKHTLFANVSHEFRTPLSLIMAPVEVLKSSLVDKYQVHQANLISKNAKRLTLLVEQVLDLAKLENTTIKQYQKYSIEQAVNSVFDTFLPLAESKMQKLGVSCNCNGVLYLTSDSFEKIVSNIVMNAIKYTPREGTILIEAEKVDDYLLLSVTDDGPGIDLDKQEKIFERFSRIDVSEQVVGSGLGLAIASELAIFNDGKIWVKSSLGQGAKFYIRLPLAEFDLSDHDIKNVKVKKIESEYLVEETNKINYFPQDKHTKDLSVLIVEDSTDLRGFLSDALSSVFNCVTAKDGLEGFEIATKNLPDLIITDYAMPNIDGHQFTDMLRNEETTSHIPIIMLTAKGDEENRKESWRKDIDDFIPKPFELEELKLRINRLISIRERLRKRYSNDVNLVLANGTDRTAVSFANKKDQEFYQRFEEMIEENFSSEAFNRPTAANKMALSERQLNRKLGALIDHNFSEYLRKFRMQKAKQFLLEGRQITEVSFDVGFSSPSYFSSCFKTEFGLSPSEFVERGTAGVT